LCNAGQCNTVSLVNGCFLQILLYFVETSSIDILCLPAKIQIMVGAYKSLGSWIEIVIQHLIGQIFHFEHVIGRFERKYKMSFQINQSHA